MKHQLFVISAPSGAGKTTLVNMLTNEFDNIVRSISYTTREKRKSEEDGKDYFFVTIDAFNKKIQDDNFLEYAKVFDNYYGTDRAFVEKNIQNNKSVVLVIDVQGALQIKEKNYPATFIFIKPPSTEDLKKRLEKRNADSDEIIEKRLKIAKEELLSAKNYDCTIINDDLGLAYRNLKDYMLKKINS
jgi:guanylate kinase